MTAPQDADAGADPTAVLRFDGDRWICVGASPQWRALSGPRPSLEGEPIGALLPDRFLAEGLGRLCDLAALTSTLRRLPIPAVAGVPRAAIATPEAPAPDDPAPRVRLTLAPGPGSTLEETQEALDRASPALVAVFGPDLRVIDVNDHVIAVSGLERDQILGRTNAEMGYPPAVAALWDDHHRRVFQSRRPHLVEYDLPTVLGPRRYESEISPVVDQHGAVVAVSVRSRDTTGLRLSRVRADRSSETGTAVLSAIWQRLDPQPGAAATARRAVAKWLCEAGMSQFATAAELAVSELVTNAAMHARTDIYVQAEHLADAVRLEVHDGSGTMPASRVPTTLGGRGLALVALVADRWGADPTPAGKVVWCEFEHGPPVRTATASPDSLIDFWAEAGQLGGSSRTPDRPVEGRPERPG